MSINLDGSADTPGTHDSCAQKRYSHLSSEMNAIQEKIASGRLAAIVKTALSTILAVGGVIGVYKTSNHGKDFVASPAPLASTVIALLGARAAWLSQKGINGPTDPEEERRIMMLEQELYIAELQLKKESHRTHKGLREKG